MYWTFTDLPSGKCTIVVTPLIIYKIVLRFQQNVLTKYSYRVWIFNMINNHLIISSRQSIWNQRRIVINYSLIRWTIIIQSCSLLKIDVTFSIVSTLVFRRWNCDIISNIGYRTFWNVNIHPMLNLMHTKWLITC